MNPKITSFLTIVFFLLLLQTFAQSQPVITVDPQQIEIEFPPDDNPEIPQEYAIRIGNEGNAVLFWASRIDIINQPERNIPRRDDAGDLIAEFQGINAAGRNCSPIAWDYDNEKMWVITTNPNIAAAYSHDVNYENFREDIRLNLGECIDGAWANGILFLSPIDGEILNRFDSNGNNLGAVRLPFPIDGVAADQVNERLFVMSANDSTIHVYSVNNAGDDLDEIGRIRNHIEFNNRQSTRGMEWVNDHRDGQLWLTSPADGRVHQIAVNTDNWECTEEVQSFVVFPDENAQQSSSVAHDGYNLWAGGFDEDNIRVYEDGITETHWLVLEPTEGAIEPASDMDVIMVCSAMGLIGGQYDAEIHFFSNDPNSPDIAVAVSAAVVGVPSLSVRWNEEAGFPEVIDFNRFGEVWRGRENIVPLSIRNSGNDDLAIDDISFDQENFVANPSNFVLAPGARQNVDVSYFSDEGGLTQGILNLVSNDPNHEEFDIPVQAEAFNPPAMVVDTASVDLRLGQGESVDEEVRIENHGEYPLVWNTELIGIHGPDQDSVWSIVATVDPSSGSVVPNEASTVTIHFELIDFNDLPEIITLAINSNDPDLPTTQIEFNLHPLGIAELGGRPIPGSLELTSVHPNPFNSSAVIEYSIPVRSEARVSILDMSGRIIMSHSEGVLEAGWHSLTLDAGSLPAGTYLARIEAGNEARLTKAVVIK